MAEKAMNGEINKTVNTLFEGMNMFLSNKTVVGEPVTVGNTVIIPLVDVNIGVGAGAFASAKGSNNVGGGMGGKLSPSAVLVITDGNARMVSVKETDSLSKVVDMVPEVISKIQSFLGKNKKKDEEDAAVEEVVAELKDETF